MLKHKTIDSPIGNLTIQSDGEFITAIYFQGEKPEVVETSCPITEKCAAQLHEYFAGERKIFDVPLKPKGGEFFQRVWKMMIERVPYGETSTYSEVAEMIGNKKAMRAVGMANNRNPIPIIIPCHRIVGKNKSLVGFRGGLYSKRFLLVLEHQSCKERCPDRPN